MKRNFLLTLTIVTLSTTAALSGDLLTRYAPPPMINGGPGNKVGILSCKIDPSIGLILAEFQKMQCSFTPNNSAQVELYSGRMANLGLNLGFTVASVLTWGVYAPTKNLLPGSLAGTYGGASIGVAVVFGAGANFLIGGSKNSIALQPWSVEGTAGLNASLGLQNMELRSAI